jgi:hypothetical protein
MQIKSSKHQISATISKLIICANYECKSYIQSKKLSKHEKQFIHKSLQTQYHPTK